MFFLNPLEVFASITFGSIIISSAGSAGSAGSTGSAEMQVRQQYRFSRDPQAVQVQQVPEHQGLCRALLYISGTAGSTGSAGSAGASSPAGSAGSAGSSPGSAGTTGSAGSSGSTGSMGGAGSAGTSGTSGSDGDFGEHHLSINTKRILITLQTHAGEFRISQTALGASGTAGTTPQNADMILIHQTDEDGSNINSFLVTVDDSTSPIKGHVKITNNQDPTEYVMYAISGALTEVTDAVNGNYFKFNLVYLSEH